jgi:two-component system response regulator TctD
LIVLFAGAKLASNTSVAERLGREGHHVSWTGNDGRALDHVVNDTYDLILLSADNVRSVAIGAIATARRRGISTPIVVIADVGETRDRIAIMDRGADDCLVKPLCVDELEARMRALTRRYRMAPESKADFADVVLDTAAREVTVGGNKIGFNRREFRLFELLVRRLDQVVPKERLMDQLFGYEDDVGPNALELYISRIRRKLGVSGLRIETIRRVGYRARAGGSVTAGAVRHGAQGLEAR